MAILYHGDCLDEMIQIEDNSVDLIYTDLPYATKTFGSCTACEWDKPIDLEKMWAEFMRIKKLHTPIFMSCNVKLGYDLLRTCPKKCPFRYDIIHVKSSKSGFLNSHRAPLRSHELIYVFYEKSPFYDLSSHKHKFIDQEEKQIIKGENNTYNTEKRKKPLVREKGDKYNPPLPVSVLKPEINEKYTYEQDGKDTYGFDKRKEVRKGKDVGKSSIYDPPLPDSVLEIKSQRGKHSTQKPLELMKWILKYYSKDSDIIFDCCMGSGSMGVACAEMNRNFIGIEMNPEIYEVACERIHN